MFLRQTVTPLDASRLSVTFDADGQRKEVLVSDSALITELLDNRRATREANDALQDEARRIELDFDTAAKSAELLYQQTAASLRAAADGRLETARTSRQTATDALNTERAALEDTAFKKAELQMIADAKAAAMQDE